MPLWAYTLASWVPPGWEPEILYARVVSLARARDSRVFAFSAIHQDLASVERARRALKARWPDAIAILGGPITWSFEMEGKLALLSGFDHLYFLDGEETLPRYPEAVAAGREACGVRQFQFACDNFIGSLRWAHACVDAILEWKPRRGATISIFTWLTIHRYKSPELMEKMRRAGFDVLFIGVESVNHHSSLETAKVQNIDALPTPTARSSPGAVAGLPRLHPERRRGVRRLRPLLRAPVADAGVPPDALRRVGYVVRPDRLWAAARG